MHTAVYCKVVVEGIHRWEECPIEEVSYLRNDHRHLFHIRAFKTVNHADRDVEFIRLKHQIERFMKEMWWSEKHNCYYFGKMSCEMIAKIIVDEFNLDVVEVNEDDENGCVVTKGA